MGWREDKSKKRVKENDFSDFELEVKDLSKSMDFTNLGPKDVRRAVGVHLYADVPNFHLAVQDCNNNLQKQKKVVRAASVLRKIQGELLEQDEIGDIQRQSVRAHGLVFKPYNAEKDNKTISKDSDRAKSAVKHAITQNTYVREVFNPCFSDVRNFESSVGLSSGQSYLANIGKKGKRELISLGTCANLAAKVIGPDNTISVTKEMFDVLPDYLQAHFEESNEIAGVKTYQAKGLSWTSHPDLAKKLGVDWDAEKWTKKTKTYIDDLPLDDIEVSDATVRIDVSQLTERNCKRTQAVVLYADLDGFTRYVQDAETDDKVISLIRQFRMIRAEFQTVTETDYEGLVLQHQGDCTLSILHLPHGDGSHSSRCKNAVDIAIGLQSSMDHVLNELLTDRKEIRVAVGLDVGKVIVSRLGKKGERTTICLGPEVVEAERLQHVSKAQQIRISSEIYDQIEDEWVKAEFSKSGKAYVATGLTFPKLDEKREKAAAIAGTLGAKVVNGEVRVTSNAPASGGTWMNSKPWMKGN